jgi:hypothetical protein
MARKRRSKQGSAIYAKRIAIVEPVNGQIKEARGLRQFLLRGLEKVDVEWHLIGAGHNLRPSSTGTGDHRKCSWSWPPDEGQRPWRQSPGLSQPPTLDALKARPNPEQLSSPLTFDLPCQPRLYPQQTPR